MLEKEAEVIYVDTTNYCNNTNISALLTQVMTGHDIDSSSEELKAMMTRLKVYDIYTIEDLIIFLSTVINLFKNKSPNFHKPNMIIIDSLSSMTAAVPQKAQITLYLKEVLTLVKILNKRYYCMVIFTNNAYDGATKISELGKLVQEPMNMAVDKSIYCAKHEGLVNYIVIHS